MADTPLDASNYEKVERPPQPWTPDGSVFLAPDRWAALSAHVRKTFNDPRPFDHYRIFEPTQIGDVLFLPAVYRPA